ncbi:hypothetical protein ACFE04_008850 [Oxalis oulophora]
MDNLGFHDRNIYNILDSRTFDHRHDFNHNLQMHSSLIRRLSQETELEGHDGCVNAVAWNSKGSLLISGSDDTRINIWSYSSRKLLHSIETGHSANIFCTKFVPETNDELVVSGAGDAEVRLFNLSRLSGSGVDDGLITPTAHYMCHSRRVKKLAVEAGNPNVVWSASEDGTLRQHDFREGASCPPAGPSRQECRNILLDLRSGAKRSLADPPRNTLSLKSCDISSSRPHLLLVGGSDAFARLYDRRMLPPMSSCAKRTSPPPCVNYFSPMHLSERGRSGLHLTHVTFSPNGEEVLLSYSGEHVYLMNVNNAGGGMRYTSGDVSKLTSYSPILNGLELQPPVADIRKVGRRRRSSVATTVEKCRELVEIAKSSLEEGNNLFYGIEACNEVLYGNSCDIGPILLYECLCTRAGLFLKRKWKNDVHMAIRDCYSARRINSSSFKALYFMSEALEQLGKHKEALDFATAAQCVAPSSQAIAEKVENIKKNVVAAEAEKDNKANDGTPKPPESSRPGRVVSVSDILYRSEPHNEDAPRSDREDSDYDEELELDFETSMSGDEGPSNVEPNILHGSLNLRIHRRGEGDGSNGSCGSPSSSPRNDTPSYQPEAVIDMKRRYVGHCNVGTDIKQASFLGQEGEFVASGSDDGRWFIWEKQSGRLIKVLLGDKAVVNCVQSHPFDCVVATSGIDNSIKLWSPTAPVPSIMGGGAVGPETGNFLEAIERLGAALLNFWNGFGCMNLLRDPYIHLSVLRADQHSAQLLLEAKEAAADGGDLVES